MLACVIVAGRVWGRVQLDVLTLDDQGRITVDYVFVEGQGFADGR
jgi:hypothetical protein